MLTIHFFKGLPGSGKSTEALRMVREGNGAYVRVNKDDLRAMLHAGHYSKGNEEQVLNFRNRIIHDSLLSGKHVIVDDTNFEPKHRATIEVIAKEVRSKKGTCVVQERFFDTPVEECIARDLKRTNSVGEKVIRSMWRKYLAPMDPDPEPPALNPGLPMAIVVDIDGTIARMDGRGPFDWHRVGEDKPHTDIIYLVNELSRDNLVILCSGRDNVCRSETLDWLRKHDVPYHELYMRPEGSMEKDRVVKERIYKDHIKGKYNVLFVVDDRNQVVDLWRSLGLRCLQVAPGDF